MPPTSARLVDSDNLAGSATDVLDLLGGNMHLSPASLAIDHGDPSYAPATDIDGLARPVDGDGNGTKVPDIGAHEYVRSGG